MGKSRTAPLSPGTITDFNDLAFGKNIYGAEMLFDAREWSRSASVPAKKWDHVDFPPLDVKKIPAKPGVYIFFVQPDVFGIPQASGLMYVGKAKSLQSRIGSYIAEVDSPWAKTKRPMVWRMVNAWHGHLKYCYTTTATVTEAEQLEEQMLQSLQPPMNRHIPGEVGKRARAF